MADTSRRSEAQPTQPPTEEQWQWLLHIKAYEAFKKRWAGVPRKDHPAVQPPVAPSQQATQFQHHFQQHLIDLRTKLEQRWCINERTLECIRAAFRGCQDSIQMDSTCAPCIFSLHNTTKRWQLVTRDATKHTFALKDVWITRMQTCMVVGNVMDWMMESDEDRLVWIEAYTALLNHLSSFRAVWLPR